MDRPNSALKVPYKNLMGFFTLWLKFLRPFHTLSDRELEVAACMLKNRYELSKKISDEKILNDVLFSKENKDKMMKELHITNQYYQVILGKLRKVKFIRIIKSTQDLFQNMKKVRCLLYYLYLMKKR